MLLTPQEDETKLAAECALVGGLLGCGDGAREVGGKPTLAKIMRGLAAGAVRARCELRERRIQVSSRSIRTQPRARTTNDSCPSIRGVLLQRQTNVADTCSLLLPAPFTAGWLCRLAVRSCGL